MSTPVAALAISASSEVFSLALRGANGAVHVARSAAHDQSAAMVGMLDDLLARAGMQVDDLRQLRVDRGPGSYTGLRMALTFARVVAEFGDLPLAAATSLELLALAAWRRHGAPTARAVRPMLDARRDRVHTARVELRDGCVALVQAPAAVPLRAAADAWRDDEVALLAPTLANAAEFTRVRASAQPIPPICASDLFDAALTAPAIAPADLEPLYLMGSYAD